MNGRTPHPLITALLASASLLPGLRGADPSPSPTAGPKIPAAANSPVAAPPQAATKESLTARDIPGIHGKISIPADWTFLPGKLLEGDVLLAVREKIAGENDPWTTGLSMTIDRNGAKDSGMKAGDYALGIAKEAREKAGEEASPIADSTKGGFREIRFDFPVQTDPPLHVTEVLRANERTGTVTVILWQSPKCEADALRDLRESVLSGIILDPAQ
jgi:hypothetical protein